MERINARKKTHRAAYISLRCISLFALHCYSAIRLSS